MPRTAALFLIGSVAIGGIPPLNGFISEFIIYNGLIAGFQSENLFQIIIFITSLAGLALIGGLSLLTFTKTFGTIFLGSSRETLHHQPKEVSQMMLIPQYLIIFIMLAVAFFPKIFLHAVLFALPGNSQNILVETSLLNSYAETIFSISIFSLLFVGLIFLLWFSRSLFVKKLELRLEPTWGCGYTAPTNKMQYTGKSFTKPLGKIFNFLLLERKKYAELKSEEIFPPQRKYSSHYLDFFEYRFIDNITQRLIYSANYFKFIQNGRIQSYVLYGIIFIITVFIFTLINFAK
jgi:NADH:ubiquinone oxidoreductase subunit 5 (subunit L)/multisubunit Na+/H+ antiporter MnhA subunit